MEDLDYYKSKYRSYQNQISSKQAEKAQYLAIAEEITEIYNRMKEDKSTLKTYRTTVKNFRKESYNNFSGNLQSAYKDKMSTLQTGYSTVIANLDDNLDRLNTARANYENKAYQCDGVLGNLRASLNTVAHIIQNWVN